MNNIKCLNDQDLILHCYGELKDDSTQKLHLDNCPLCAKRLAFISNDLARLPALEYESNRFAGTRMAARVSEKIRQPKRNRLVPVIGIAVTATLAMVTAFIVSPQQQVNQLAHVESSALTNGMIEDSMPDIDFLEEFEFSNSYCFSNSNFCLYRF